MKFTKLEIEKNQYSFKGRKGAFRGKIHFDSESGDWIVLSLNDELCKKFLELSIPLFERATNEKLEIIKKEIENGSN